MSAVPPMFRDLDVSEAQQILTRNHVGRIAFSFHDRVDIEPIHYVYADGAIYMRTAAGTKLDTLAHSPWIAFEVDEVEGPYDWRSVVAHGTVYVLADIGTTAERESYRQAVHHLRSAAPNALREGDPTPDRTIVLEVRPASVTGRAARSTKPQSSAHR